jgi:hypothetical protein
MCKLVGLCGAALLLVVTVGDSSARAERSERILAVTMTNDPSRTTTSAPVSVGFANEHMYVAGATSVDSFALHENSVGWLDGSTGLELVSGGAPPGGSTAQVGAIDGRQLLVTLKSDPDPRSLGS